MELSYIDPQALMEGSEQHVLYAMQIVTEQQQRITANSSCRSQYFLLIHFLLSAHPL